MSDGRVRRRLALGALQLFLLTTASLSPAAVARAQDTPEPAALTLELLADVTTFGAVGDVITYEYALINNGGVAIDELYVDAVATDELGSVPCPSTSLEPGESVVCADTYTITQDDLDAGSVTNIAQADGLYGGNEEVVSNEASLTITAVTPEPAALTLELLADVTTFGAVGDVITYEYALINNGGVAIDELYVDAVATDELGSVPCPSTSLEPGESVVCADTYTITQDDLDAGSVTNIAQADGLYGGNEEVVSNEASLTITAVTPEPAALTLELLADVTTFGAVGDVITYEYALINNGGVAIDELYVDAVATDELGSVPCPSTSLEPGESVVCADTYTITQDDLDAGSVTNIAQADGLYGGNEEVVSNEASLTITAVTPEPAALTLELLADVTTFGAVGDVITYEYALINNGGVAIDELYVDAVATDELGSVPCPSTSLEPGESVVCADTYTITQADLDAGAVTNIAQAFGAYGEGEVVASEEADLTITAVTLEPAALTLELGSLVATFSAVDEVIEYDYELTNTGGVALDVLSVTPELGDVVCPSRSLEPGDSFLCVGYYTITQADLDAGAVTNIAQAFGAYGEGEVVASEEADLTITAVTLEPAALTLELGSLVATFSAVDEVIEYDYELTNTGGVALDVLSVTPELGDVVCPSRSLEPGDSFLCVGYYDITQADLDAGAVTNIAQAFGAYGEGEVVASEEADLTITAVTLEPAALTLELGSLVATFSAVDEVIEYDYELTNTGGVALDVLSVTPELGDVVCPSRSLEPGDSFLCVGYYTITQADLDAGAVTNIAQAFGAYGEGEVVASEEADLTITAVTLEPAALTLELGSLVATFSAVDEVIEYDYELTNTGGVALDVLSVTPELGDVVCPSRSLEPGDSFLCVGYYTITQADLDAGAVTNIAQAFGAYGEGEVVASEEADLTITAVTLEPAALTLELGSLVATFSAVDEVIEYDYELTNTGGVALDVLSVTPELGDVVCPSRSLEPGDSFLCVGYYTITQADLDAGSVTNIAQAFGAYGEGEVVASEEADLTITLGD